MISYEIVKIMTFSTVKYTDTKSSETLYKIGIRAKFLLFYVSFERKKISIALIKRSSNFSI